MKLIIILNCNSCFITDLLFLRLCFFCFTIYILADIVEMNLEMTTDEIEILVNATMQQLSNGTESITYDQYIAYAQKNREKFQAEMTVQIKHRLIN